MNQAPYAITAIEQVDNHSFRVVWSDNVEQRFTLSHLQKHCPCAQCNVDGPKVVVDPDVRAVKISSLGRYAMKIQFTSGCSKGIYTYAMLRENLEEKRNP